MQAAAARCAVSRFEILLEHDVDERYMFEPGETLVGDVILVLSGTLLLDAIQVGL